MKTRSRHAQARILESLVAAVLMYILFTTVYFMLFSSEKPFKMESVDLNRLSYNSLHHLAGSSVIEEVVNEPQSSSRLFEAIQTLLPRNVYFNLTIYERDGSGLWILKLSISNAEARVFELSSEVAASSTVYTSKKGEIYLLCLKLTRVGLT